MTLKKAILTYTELDGWPNYSNHTSTVVLHFDLDEADFDGGEVELNRRIDAKYAMCEAIVGRSIERTQLRRPEPKANGNGHANGGHTAPPPAQSAAATPPPPPVQPPPAPVGNGPPPPVNRVFGPPTNAATFAGWLNNEGRIYRDQATKLCKQLGYGTWFKALTDEQALYLYGQLYGSGQNGSTR
jgi:hypothetical protein